MLGSEAPGLILHRPSRQGESRRGLGSFGRLSLAEGKRGPNAEFGVKHRNRPICSRLSTCYSLLLCDRADFRNIPLRNGGCQPRGSAA